MKINKTVKDAIKVVEDFNGKPEDFELAICNSLLDPTGMNMAIITDKVLGKGMMPNGFEDKEGYRLFRYTAL